MLNHYNEPSNNNISNYPVVNKDMTFFSYTPKDKSKLTENDIYNACYDKWITIRRACDNSKTIVHEAVFFIAAFEFLFLKDPDEIVFSSDLLCQKTETGKKQRGRYLKQLADIYHIEYHNKYVYKGKVRRCVFSAKRTEDSLKILTDPKLFYSQLNDNRGSQKTNLKSVSVNQKHYQELQEKPSQNDLIKTPYVVKNDPICSQKSPYTGSNLTPTYKDIDYSKNNKDLNNFVILNIAKQEEDVDCLNSSEEYSNFGNSDNKQKMKNENEFELTKEKQVELLQSLSGNTTPPPAITNLMKSEIYKAPEAYHWDYQQYRKDHGMDEIKEETPTTIVSKGLEMLQSLKIVKQEEVIILPESESQRTPTLAVPDTVKPVEKQVTEQLHKPATPSINANGRFEPHSEFKPNFLRNYRFNRQQFDEIRILTDDFELTDDEIIGTIQGIVTDKPDTQIWGGRKVFINFMVKVLNNERRGVLQEDSESIADIELKKYEKALYNFENKIIEWF